METLLWGELSKFIDQFQFAVCVCLWKSFQKKFHICPGGKK